MRDSISKVAVGNYDHPIIYNSKNKDVDSGKYILVAANNLHPLIPDLKTKLYIRHPDFYTDFLLFKKMNYYCLLNLLITIKHISLNIIKIIRII